jgi:putative DNA primase/helicase
MSPFGLEPMQGSTVCVFPDFRQPHGRGAEKLQPAIERMLTITGGDMVAINRKGRPITRATLPLRFLLVTNRLPEFPDPSGAIAGRFITLATAASFLGREDLYLSETLVGEMRGILRWAVEGAQRLFKRGFLIVPQMAAGEQEAMFDLSTGIGRFVREHCDRGAKFTDEISLVYAGYEIWCEEESQDLMPKHEFGKALREFARVQRIKGPRDQDGHRQWLYSGVRLRPSGPLYSGAVLRRDEGDFS